MAPSPSPLLNRRLIIVTGKGGTGKTTVAAALALGASARGRRVLVVAVSPDARLGPLLAPGAGSLRYTPQALREGVFASHIEPFEALAEYLGLQLGGRRWLDPILRQKAFRQLLSASPGWRELITLGKIWHLEQMRSGSQPLYDLVVVDAPATGHGITFLDVPRVVASAIRAGPLRHHTEQVEALIEDHERTLLLPVALAEELPARETIELVARARERLEVALDRVVVNAVHAPPYPERFGDLEQRLAALPPQPAFETLPPPPVLASCGATLRARARLNARYRREIGRQTGLPVLTLPYLSDGVNGPGDVERLAEALLCAPAEAA